jgi:hypothetical protein
MSRSSMTVLTHPSGEDLVMAVLNRVSQSQGALKAKVVYATREIAEEARIALEHLPGTRSLFVYECQRAKRVPHYHLASCIR